MFTQIFKSLRKNPELGVSLRRKTLGWSQLEGGFFSLMVGCSETFALYYAVKRGLDRHELALITTLPIVLGSLANWIVPQFVKTRYLKKALLGVVITQLFGVLGLYLSVGASNHFWWIMGALSLYWIGGMAAGPLWIDWMSGWLPRDRLSRYLSRRNAFTALFTVVGYLVGAYGIHQNESALSFQFVFALAFFARLASIIILSFQPHPEVKGSPHHEPFKISAALQSKPIWMMIIFTVAFRFVANIASPFFLPYMVDEIHLSLMSYAWLTSVPFFARAAFLAQWGEAVRSYRPYIALQIGMILLAAVCMLWTLTTQLHLLSLIEAFSGIAWGGIELSVVLILQGFAPRKARALTGFHVALMHIAALLGALIGSKLFEAGLSTFDVFRISSFLRFLVGFTFIIVGLQVHEMRTSLKVYGEFFMTAMSLRPQLFALGRFIPEPLKRLPSTKTPKTKSKI